MRFSAFLHFTVVVNKRRKSLKYIKWITDRRIF